MSTHTAELADGHSAIHIQGDAAGYEERVAAMRRERDAYAAGDQVDPSKLYRMDRQLARWQKAVDEAKEKESGSATKDVSAQYSDAAFAELGYPEWDGTDYTPESVAENWDRILALASLDVLSDTQKKEARSAAKALMHVS